MALALVMSRGARVLPRRLALARCAWRSCGTSAGAVQSSSGTHAFDHSVTAGDVAVLSESDDRGWLVLRPIYDSEATHRIDPEILQPLEAQLADQRKQELAVCSGSRAASIAFEVGHDPEAAHDPALHELWKAVVARLKEVEFEAMDAILVLHSMVKMRCCDRELLTRVVDRIECRYYSMDLGFGDRHRVGNLKLPARLKAEHASKVPKLDAAELFPHSGTFQSLVNSLPTDHKVKIIVMDNVERDDGRCAVRALPEEPDPKKKWRTVDPIEMEAWERERFDKGRIRVKRMRYVEAKPTRMRPGNKLAATLAAQFLQVLPSATAATLAKMSQICAFPKVRPLHGDLLEDFQEELSRAVHALEREQVLPHILAFTAGMRNFGGSKACRVWKRTLIPVVIKALKDAPESLRRQEQSFHDHLRGVPHVAGEEAELRMLAERAAQLFVSVTTARQVNVDSQLFDALATALKVPIRRWLRESAAPGKLLPLETLADALDACVTCGVDDKNAELPKLLLVLVVKELREAIQRGEEEESESPELSVADLSTIAHAAALLCGKGGDAEEALDLIWEAAEPMLQTSEPHLVLMLLDALVRAGSEALLTSKSVVTAVDEHLTQRLDMDPSVLGHLAS